MSAFQRSNADSSATEKYGRVFHPQQFGHLMITEAILHTMDSVHAKFIGQSATTTTLIDCPAPTGPASHAGEHHRCFPDSKEPDHAMFSIDNADAAIKTYCLKHQNDKVTIHDGILNQVPNGAGSSTSLILRASLETEPSCQKFPNLGQWNGQWNFFDCSKNLTSAMNDYKSHLFHPSKT